MNFFIFANWENSWTWKSARQVFLNMPENRAAFWNIPEIFENPETLQWHHLVFIVSMGCQDLAAADKPYLRGWVALVLVSWEDSRRFTFPFPCQPALAGHMQGNSEQWTVGGAHAGFFASFARTCSATQKGRQRGCWASSHLCAHLCLRTDTAVCAAKLHPSCSLKHFDVELLILKIPLCCERGPI